MTKTGRALLTTLALTLLSGAAGATLLRALTLEEVAADSVRIVIATARSTVAERGEDGLIRTRVTFDRLTGLKGGDPGPALALTFAGGRVGRRFVRVPGMPEYRLGERYVLFVAEDRDPLCPVVGWTQGTYRLAPDPATGAESVFDAAGRPVYGFEEGRPLHRAKDGARSILRAEDFLDRVRSIVARQAPAVEDPEVADPPADGPEAEGGGAPATDGGGR